MRLCGILDWDSKIEFLWHLRQGPIASIMKKIMRNRYDLTLARNTPFTPIVNSLLLDHIRLWSSQDVGSSGSSYNHPLYKALPMLRFKVFIPFSQYDYFSLIH